MRYISPRKSFHFPLISWMYERAGRACPAVLCSLQRDAGQCFDAALLASDLCQTTCGRCRCPGVCVCTDIPPSVGFTCGQQTAWGKVGRA